MSEEQDPVAASRQPIPAITKYAEVFPFTDEPAPGHGEQQEAIGNVKLFVKPIEPGFARKTIGAWYDAGRALSDIIARPRSLPQQTQYKLARMFEGVRGLIEYVDAEKVKQAQILGEAREDGSWRLKDENKAAFEAAITQVIDQPADLKVPVLYTHELGSSEQNGIEAREFLLLGDLVQERPVAVVPVGKGKS